MDDFEYYFHSTPESRAEWSVEEWVTGIGWRSDIIEDPQCPRDKFTAEDWACIILDSDSGAVQYCDCPDEVLPLLSREDFEDFGSYEVCQLLAMEGEWLAPLLPLDRIDQEDFDAFLVCYPDDYESEEEFLRLVGSKFPDGKIPAHLDYPHKGESGRKNEDPLSC